MKKAFINFYKSYKPKEILNISVASILSIIMVIYYGIFWLPIISPNTFGFLSEYSTKMGIVNIAPYIFLPVLLFIYIMYNSILLKLPLTILYMFNLSYVFYTLILEIDEGLSILDIIIKAIPYIISVFILFIVKDIFNKFKRDYLLEENEQYEEEFVENLKTE